MLLLWMINFHTDYVNCRFCGRNFNKNAAERHVPFCELQNKRQKANTSANQKQKVNINNIVQFK